MPANLIAVNLGSYGRYRENAPRHLQQIGIRHVEIAVPSADIAGAVAEQFARFDLSISTMTAPCDLTKPAEAFLPHAQTARAMEVPILFISAKAGDMPRQEACARLRELADLADAHGVTLSLETHPDLAENATVARQTLEAVGHPRLGWNLDTANLYYYNQGGSAVEECRRGLDLIRSVHLKDTNGGYRTWHFPALGDGVVDFAGVFRLLNEREFHGPFTFELEGIEGESLSEAETQARVARSLDHLRQIGVVANR
jgi:sugar phosphate isomerase/epimerase